MFFRVVPLVKIIELFFTDVQTDKTSMYFLQLRNIHLFINPFPEEHNILEKLLRL